MAFLPNAFALTIRPIAPPMEGAGARSRTRNFQNLSIRVTISYDSIQQAHIVVLDFLAGINPVYDELIVPMFA
jgi:hypothetical protein